MAVDKEETTLGDLGREDWIPIISVILIIFAVVFSGFNYWVIDTAATLFFYAVLVQTWTELGPDDARFLNRDGQFVEFIMMAVGAVVVGTVFREAARYITGDILAVQSIALGVLFSRWYINAKNASVISTNTILRYTDPFDQRLVIAPCLFSFFLPALQYRTGIYIFNFETREGFLGLLITSILFGVFLHWYKTGDLEEFQRALKDQ